jgi:hypothetical protein
LGVGVADEVEARRGLRREVVIERRVEFFNGANVRMRWARRACETSVRTKRDCAGAGRASAAVAAVKLNGGGRAPKPADTGWSGAPWAKRSRKVKKFSDDIFSYDDEVWYAKR